MQERCAQRDSKSRGIHSTGKGDIDALHISRVGGEQIDPLPDPLPRWLVLLIPDVLVRDKTRTIYRMLEPKWYTAGGFALNLAQRLLFPAADDPVSLYLRLRERNPATPDAFTTRVADLFGGTIEGDR